MNNALVAFPALLVTAGLGAPIFVLDGRDHYIRFLWQNPTLVSLTYAAWAVLLYWVTRRAAAVVLLRTAGAKLKVGDDRLAP